MAIKKKSFFQKKVKKRKHNKFFSYNNEDRADRDFLYKNFEKSNSYNTNFTRSKFTYVNFFKSTMKYCGFNGALFIGSEFKNANLRGSRFKGAVFKDVIFINTKLDKAVFTGALFENVIFVGSNIGQARGLLKNTPGITIYTTMPNIELSSQLKQAIGDAIKNPYIKESEVLQFNKKQRLNNINIQRLLEIYSENQLLMGLRLAKDNINKKFYTLSYIVKFFSKEAVISETSNQR